MRPFFRKTITLGVALYILLGAAIAHAWTIQPFITSSASPQNDTPSPQTNNPGKTFFAALPAGTSGGLQNNCRTSFGAGQDTYCFLAPINLPGFNLTVGIDEGNISNYLRSLFTLLISVGGIALFFSLVFAGLQYIWGGAQGRIESEDKAKERIRNAGFGTAIALGSYIILRTINPDIVNFKFDIPPVTVRGNGGETRQNSFQQGLRTATKAEEGLGIGAAAGDFMGGRGAVQTGPRFQNTNLTNEAGFRNDAWNTYALERVRAEGLSQISIRNAEAFFPEGKVTDEAWVELLGKIARKESSFDPNRTYNEGRKLNYVNSVGLLQLSATDKEARELGYSEEDLKDPYKNIEVGVKIMARQLKKDGVIAEEVGGGKWIGGSAYWSTLRRPL